MYQPVGGYDEIRVDAQTGRDFLDRTDCQQEFNRMNTCPCCGKRTLTTALKTTWRQAICVGWEGLPVIVPTPGEWPGYKLIYSEGT